MEETLRKVAEHTARADAAATFLALVLLRAVQ